jgi:uncharacterized protein involved in exopolysaccharide biosynthesis
MDQTQLVVLVTRHAKLMAVCFLVIMGVTVTFTVFGPRTFVSQATLLIRLGRENATLDSTTTLGAAPVVAVPPNRENDVNSVIEIIKSRVLLDQIVDAIGPEVILEAKDFEPHADRATHFQEKTGNDGAVFRYRALRNLASGLSVEAVKKSNVIVLSYGASSTELAQAVLTKLISFALDRHLQLHRSPGACEFMEEQADRLRQSLVRSEQEQKELMNKTGISFPDGQKQILVNRIGRLEDELLLTTSNLAAAEAEVRQLTKTLAGLARVHVTSHTQGMPNQAADAMRGQLYSLQLKEVQMSVSYPEQHPELQRLRQQIATAKANLAAEEKAREQTTEGPNRTYEEIQLALLKQEPLAAGLRDKCETLRNQLTLEHAALARFNEHFLALSNSQREVNLLEAYYRKYRENAEQARIDQALKNERISSISILQPPTYELKPARPKVLVNLGVGCLFAVLSSIAVAYAAEYRRTRRLPAAREPWQPTPGQRPASAPTPTVAN